MSKFFENLFGKKDDETSEVSQPTLDESMSGSAEVKTQPRVMVDNPHDDSTAPLTDEQIAEISSNVNRIEPAQLTVGIGHNVGRQRENNQDSVFTFTANLGTAKGATPFGIYIVADGMGGHKDGHLASEYAIRTMGNYLVQKLYHPLFGITPEAPEESLQEILRHGVLLANENVIKHAPGGGTTITAALVRGTQMTLAHVGDSRAYNVYLDGRMQMLTRDHSLVKRLEELGQITAEEAAVHPQKSMLYRALGQSEPQDPDVFNATMPYPGYLMICSDGLWGVLEEDQVFKIIVDAPSPQRASQTLVDAANAAGGPDNISVILVRMSD